MARIANRISTCSGILLAKRGKSSLPPFLLNPSGNWREVFTWHRNLAIVAKFEMYLTQQDGWLARGPSILGVFLSPPQQSAWERKSKLPRNKCIIILSEKASGSSACQNLLAKLADIQHVSNTRHFQNETLYWTKAASILRLPQDKMVDSEVPISEKRAREDLISLLENNLDDFIVPADDHELIMNGWTLLCRKHSPVFLEKSPHHLCQWSALELIWEYICGSDEVDTLLIGLVRNPMDTLYSQYREWKSPPEDVEKQWVRAYGNLLELKKIAGEKLVLIRYEDMVSSLDCFQPVFDFCGIKTGEADKNYLHRKSLQKWKKDRLYGFTLSEAATELAAQYGYTSEVLTNNPHPFWPIVKKSARAFHYFTAPAKRFLRSRLK